MKRILRLAACCMALMLVICTASSCGQPREAGPDASGYAPPPAVSGEKMTIAYLAMSDPARDEHTRKSLEYFQTLVNGKGWNIALTLEGALYNEETGELFAADTVQADIAAGNAADGYIVSGDDAKALLDAGLAQDLSNIVPKAVPALYNRYRALFTGAVPGLPLDITDSSGFHVVVLLLQKDVAADARISAMSDTLAFLEQNGDVKIGAPWPGFSVGILSAWAGEQGYYPLSDYGIHFAELYASYDDPQCTPVPIEAIPGFDDFFIRAMKLWESGRIVDASNSDRMAAVDIAGYVDYMMDSMDIAFLLNHKRLGGDYVALPLTGCTTPARQGVLNAYLQLAISTSSQRAEGLAAFVQWALTDRANYDLVRYGAEGVDYRLTGERVEYLINGNVLSLSDLDYNSSKAYFISRPNIFYDNSTERITAHAPGNYEAVMASSAPLAQPLWDLLASKGYAWTDSIMFFTDLYSQYGGIMEARSNLLSGTENVQNEGLVSRTGEECLAKLHAMAGDTQKLVDVCNEKVALQMTERGDEK